MAVVMAVAVVAVGGLAYLAMTRPCQSGMHRHRHRKHHSGMW